MIARTRKRPRVKSCSFRTLGWLIRREAAFCILFAPVAPELAPKCRMWAMTAPQRVLTQQVQLTIRLYSYRRYFP